MDLSVTLDTGRRPVSGPPPAEVIADAIREGVLLCSADARITWANDAAGRLLRMEIGAVTTRSVIDADWNTVRPDGRPFPSDEHPGVRALATGETQADVVLGLTVGDESTRWFSVRAVPAVHEGELVAVVVFSDVTAEFAHASEVRSVMDEIQAVSTQRGWPDDDRVDFAAGYRSVGPSRRVGGDFYGAYDAGPDRTGFFLGDVCGHGAKAAGLSALARNTLQVTGSLLSSADAVLGHLHDVINRQSIDSYLTAIYGYLESDADGMSVRFACGGHPQPILVSEGVASYIGGSGLLVGMIPNLGRTEYRTSVTPGDQLILYSDGLLSTPTPQLEEDELLAAVPTGLSGEELVEALLGIAGPAVHDVGYDDTAVLVLTFR